MASTHFVTGSVLVSWGTASSEAELGYTRDGVQWSIQPMYLDVPSDDWAGQSGAPADSQLMGAIARINCEFTKYNKSNLDALSSFALGGSAGVLPTLGTLMRQETKTGSLILAGTNETKTFSTTFIRSAFEANAGTRYRSYMVSFEGWLNATSTRVMFVDS